MKFAKTLVATALVATVGVAQAEMSANIAASSNYLFRGVTQTDDAAAVSGGIDYGHESGFYLGTWMSNVDFGGKEDAEVDLYAGFGNDIGDSGVSYDLGVLYYWYPGAGGDMQGGDLDYTEAVLGLGYGPVSATLAYTVDAESDAGGAFDDGDIYYGASVDLPIDRLPATGEGWSSSAFIGYYDFTNDGDTGVGDLSYTHWGLSVSRDAGDFGSVSMNYEQVDDVTGVNGDDNPNFWLGWSKDF